MIKWNDYLAAAMKLVASYTGYSNEFPFNCGFIHEDGRKTFDCIGLIKTLINSDCSIAYATGPAGSYIQPGLVVPDNFDEITLLNSCEGVQWNDFSDMWLGDYLYYEYAGSRHAGIYVGNAYGNTAEVNVIECTLGDWGCDGVVASWLDRDTGARRSMKTGTQIGSWVAHGHLTPFIDYRVDYAAGKSVDDIAREVIAGKWGNYPERAERLAAAGYDYRTIQDRVNQMLEG